jgi:hypothetical protein
MNEIEFIQKLDAAAGDGPPIDVSNQVLRRIRTERAADSRPMWLAAVISTLAAAAILLITVESYSGLQDPLGDLLSPVVTVFQ